MRIFGFGRKKKEDTDKIQAAGGGGPVEQCGNVDLMFDDDISRCGSDMDGDAYDDRVVDEAEAYEDYDDEDDDSHDFRGRAEYAEEFHEDPESGDEEAKDKEEGENGDGEDTSSKAYTDAHQQADNYCYVFGAGGGEAGVQEEEKDEEPPVMDPRAIEQDKIFARNHKLIKFLSKDERVRATQVFRLLDVHNEGKIDGEGFTAGLALLGMKISEVECSELFLSRKIDLIDEITFLSLVGEYRANAADEEQIAQIEGAFEDLYKGILAEREGQFAEQRDGIGRPYILASDLRNLLVTTGENMTDEEADQLIADCKPIYKVQADGTVTGKIFFEQYRSMLLPGPH